MTAKKTPHRQRRTRARGAVTVEYSVLIGTVALVCGGALVALGVAVVDDFELLRQLILFPIP